LHSCCPSETRFSSATASIQSKDRETINKTNILPGFRLQGHWHCPVPSSTVGHFVFVEVVSEDSRDAAAGGVAVWEKILLAKQLPLASKSRLR